MFQDTSVTTILRLLINIYEGILIIRVVMSWSNPNPNRLVVHIIYTLTDPVLEPIRRLIPAVSRGFDFSPIIVFLILDITKRLIA